MLIATVNARSVSDAFKVGPFLFSMKSKGRNGNEGHEGVTLRAASISLHVRDHD